MWLYSKRCGYALVTKTPKQLKINQIHIPNTTLTAITTSFSHPYHYSHHNLITNLKTILTMSPPSSPTASIINAISVFHLLPLPSPQHTPSHIITHHLHHHLHYHMHHHTNHQQPLAPLPSSSFDFATFKLFSLFLNQGESESHFSASGTWQISDFNERNED